MFQSPRITRNFLQTPNGPTPLFLSLSYTDPKSINFSNNDAYDDIFNEIKREVRLNVNKRIWFIISFIKFEMLSKIKEVTIS